MSPSAGAVPCARSAGKRLARANATPRWLACGWRAVSSTRVHQTARLGPVLQGMSLLFRRELHGKKAELRIRKAQEGNRTKAEAGREGASPAGRGQATRRRTGAQQ